MLAFEPGPGGPSAHRLSGEPLSFAEVGCLACWPVWFVSFAWVLVRALRRDEAAGRRSTARWLAPVLFSVVLFGLSYALPFLTSIGPLFVSVDVLTEPVGSLSGCADWKGLSGRSLIALTSFLWDEPERLGVLVLRLFYLTMPLVALGLGTLLRRDTRADATTPPPLPWRPSSS